MHRTTKLWGRGRRYGASVVGLLCVVPLIMSAAQPAAAFGADLGARDSRDFELTGKGVEGTDDVDSAPELTSGRYMDKVPQAEAVFYRVKRTAPGSTIHVGAMNENSSDDGYAAQSLDIGTYIEDPDDTDDGLSECNSTTSYDRELTEEKRPIAYAAINTWNSDPQAGCVTADEVIIAIGGDGEENAGMPMQLAIYEEPPLADPSGRDLDPAPQPPTWEPMEADDPDGGLEPGISLAEAPVVDEGTYQLDINAGETQIVAIPVDWGQNLQAQLEAKVSSGLISSAGDSSQIAVDVINPVSGNPQVDLSSVPAGWASGETLSTAQATGTFRTGALTYTTAYLNRASSESNSAALAGRNYVRVRFAAEEGAAVNVKYTLTLKRFGDAGSGAPEYAEQGKAKAPQADSELGGSSSPIWLAIVLGLLGLLALAAAGVLVLILITRKRSSGQGS